MKIGVVGASGYAGGELLRILSTHPNFAIEAVSAHTNSGELITSLHPHLSSFNEQRFSKFSPELFISCDLVFLALPHGESAVAVRDITAIKPTMKFVDIGADFRLEDPAAWATYYGGEHAGHWVYGLPEIKGQVAKIEKAEKIANPGCYATAVALALTPLALFAHLNDVVVVAASGTSGAGRTAKSNLLASAIMGSMSSYKFGGVHQHTPEIEQCVSKATGKEVRISFTPMLAPMVRGILATVTVKLDQFITADELRNHFTNYYAGQDFVLVLPEGEMPATHSVYGSNSAHLQVAVDGHTKRAIVSIAIDNLGKGAAGQAVQNANIMCGLAATTGLNAQGIGI
jgi:N-acetyl-gamma-glutamyl-phosphate reductase